MPAVPFFATILLVRLFKQTASVHDILLVVAAIVTVTLYTVFRERRYLENDGSLHRMFFSGAMVYAILCDVVVLVVCEKYLELIMVSGRS